MDAFDFAERGEDIPPHMLRRMLGRKPTGPTCCGYFCWICFLSVVSILLYVGASTVYFAAIGEPGKLHPLLQKIQYSYCLLKVVTYFVYLLARKTITGGLDFEEGGEEHAAGNSH
jgi:hypothetical protein